MPDSAFANIVANCPEQVFCDRAVQCLHKIGGFRWAEEYCRDAILPLAQFMTPSHIAAVTGAIKTNGQIHSASGTQENLCEFFDRVVDRLDANKMDWQHLMQHLLELDSRGALGVSHKYSNLQLKMETAGIWPVVAQ